MRLIDADALAHDLECDVELCARALDDMNVVGKEREDLQWQKDCKQNCIWYISEQPTEDAVPVIRCKDCKWFGHEITQELTEYGFYNEVHETFCYRQLANGMNDAFDVCVDDFCSWAERKDNG